MISIGAALLLFSVALHGAKSVSIFDIGTYKGQIMSLSEGEFPPTRTIVGLFDQPILFQGAAKRMPAMNWTDRYLLKHFPDAYLDQVEEEKVETRTAEVTEDESLVSFIKRYRRDQVYGISSVPKQMHDGVHLLPFFNCGGLTNGLRQNLMWFSSGGTASVIHYDTYDNQYCLFFGSKRFAFWHPDNADKIESKEFGWHRADQDDPDEQAYGEYAKLNASNVDTEEFPGWDTLDWTDVTMRAGDCLVLPKGWYHHVAATSERNLAVNLWFGSPSKFDQKSCDKMRNLGVDKSEPFFTFGDCEFALEGETKCSLKRASKRRRFRKAQNNAKTEL